MTDQTENQKEDILYAFAVEPEHTPDVLKDYVERYPQYRNELIDLSIEIQSNPIAEDTVEPGAISENAHQAWAVFQTKVSDQSTANSSVRSPLQNLDTKGFGEAAQRLNVTKVFLIRLRDCTIDYATIPQRFVQALAETVNVSVDVMSDSLDSSATISPAQSFKSDQKPAATQTMSFEEAIEASGHSEEQKAALRAYRE